MTFCMVYVSDAFVGYLVQCALCGVDASKSTETAAKSRFVGNFHFGIAAGCRSVDCRRNAIHVEFDVRPLLVPKNNDCNFPPRKILLVAHILVRRQEQLKTSFFGLSKQLTVLEFVPPI